MPKTLAAALALAFPAAAEAAQAVWDVSWS